MSFGSRGCQTRCEQYVDKSVDILVDKRYLLDVYSS